MAIIKPFKGVRPPQDLVEQVASRPYDVLNSEEARTEAAGNEKSLYHSIERRCSVVPHSFSKRSRREWASAKVSSISVVSSAASASSL